MLNNKKKRTRIIVKLIDRYLIRINRDLLRSIFGGGRYLIPG